MLIFVEDYLEFLHGSLDKDGNPVANTYSAFSKPLKLATYDKSPITSMGTFCIKARTEGLESCLTDKQADLARKIIAKYKRQFALIGIVIPDDTSSLELRHKLRAVDRSQYLEYAPETKTMTLRFPYSPKKVAELHEYSSQSAGLCEWNNDKRNWTLDATEGNLRKVLQLFDNEDLKISNELEPYVIDILKANEGDLPTLALDGNDLVLRNCHPSVHEYLTKCGDPVRDNLVRWTIHAPTLGVRLDNSVTSALVDEHGLDTLPILTNRSVVLESKNQPMGEWYTTLLKANNILSDFPWVLFLAWWTKETDWKPFNNLHDLSTTDRYNRQTHHKFAEKLQEFEHPIVVLDSIIGNDALKHFVNQRAAKVIYISDIGS